MAISGVESPFADLPHLDRLWKSNLAENGLILLGDPDRPLTGELHAQLTDLGWNRRAKRLDTPLGSARLLAVFRGEPDSRWPLETWEA